MAPGTWTITGTVQGDTGIDNVDSFGTPGWTPVVGIGGYHQKCAHFLSQAQVIFSKTISHHHQFSLLF